VIECWELEITRFEQDRLLGIRGRCGNVSLDEEHVFIPDEGNTRYTLTVEMSGSSVPAGAVQKKTVAALMHFKWQIEAPSVARP
jgi:hypothetical protein